jgi:hypothetical protein
MILERDSDSLDQYGSYSSDGLHPLWHAWLSHRLPLPPTAEVCRRRPGPDSLIFYDDTNGISRSSWNHLLFHGFTVNLI